VTEELFFRLLVDLPTAFAIIVVVRMFLKYNDRLENFLEDRDEDMKTFLTGREQAIVGQLTELSSALSEVSQQLAMVHTRQTQLTDQVTLVLVGDRKEQAPVFAIPTKPVERSGRVEEAAKLKQQGYTATQIAVRWEMAPSTVKGYWREAAA